MSRSFATPALALILASSLLAPPARAGDLNSSETTMLISIVFTVSVPFAASVGLAELSAAPFKASAKRNAVKRVPAKPLPEMEVKAVTTNTEGGRTVQLQVPGKDDQTATLEWPARADDPGAGFVVGQTVAFVPTPAGAGWNVHDAAGRQLAYVPTAYAAADSASTTW